MIRCKHIIKAYKEYNILDNVNKMSKLLFSNLSEMPEILNLRNCGLIFGFDLRDSDFRDKIVQELYLNGLICNKTGVTSIRLRPSLSITEQDIQKATNVFQKTFG